MSTPTDRLRSLTPAQLERLFDRLGARAADPPRPQSIARRPDAAPAPLSFAQQRLWFLHQWEPDSAAYNCAAALRLDGPLDRARLFRCLRQVMHRHEILRTTFPAPGGQAVQRVAPNAPLPWALMDLASLPAEAGEALVRVIAAREAALPFRLAEGPVFRVRLVCLSPVKHVLLVTMHHIVTDAWSTDLLVREVGTLYAQDDARAGGGLPPLPIQYADFAVWQRDWLTPARAETQLAYWRRQLAGIGELRLPTDRTPPARPTRRGGGLPFVIAADEAARLRALAQAEGVSLFALLVAAWQALLCRVTGETDIAVGTDVANRTHVETEALIGFFVNQLVLRTDLDGNPTVRELLARVREVTLGAYSHQDLPFERLVEELAPARRLSHAPFFRVKCVMRTGRPQAVDLSGLRVGDSDGGEQTIRNDLWLGLLDTGSEIQGTLNYAVDLFSRARARELLALFTRVRRAMADDPDRRLGELLQADETERAQLERLSASAPAAAPVQTSRSSTPTPTSSDTPSSSLSPSPVASASALLSPPTAWGGQEEARDVASAIAKVAAARPDAVAVSDANVGAISYAALLARADRLAGALRLRGVGPDVCVAVALPRGIDAIVCMLAVLRANGAYVPIDLAWPVDRIATVCDAAPVAVILASGAARDRLPWQWAELLAIDEADTWDVPLSDASPSEAPPSDALPSEALSPGTLPSSPAAAASTTLAYVMFTSGSTGRPKGVGVAHAQVLHYVRALRRELGPLAEAAWAWQTTTAADLGYTAVWGSLLSGGRLEVADEETTQSVSRFGAWVARTGVECIKITPTQLRLLAGLGGEGLPYRAVVVGGEASLTAWVAQWRAHRPGLRVWNHYGPTECTVGAVMGEIATTPRGEAGSAGAGADDEIASIGRPLTASRIHIVDTRGDRVPVGIAGELCIGGDGVARGYVGQPIETAARFLPDPFGTGAGARLYRTGDRARWRSDGRIDLLGRMDAQVKVRGFRVELGEVEAVLGAHGSVRQAVVSLRTRAAGDTELVAYVAPPVAEDTLRAHAARLLPDYMVPTTWVMLDDLPLTASGKVDRRALPAPAARNDAASALVPPRTAMEEIVAGIWADVLQLPTVGVTQDFFALGGHSLLATQCVARIRQAVGVELPLRVLFETPTVAGVAEAVQAARATGASVAPPMTAVSPRPERLPLSWAQERLWVLAQLAPESAADPGPRALTLRGTLDVRALGRALNGLEARHEVLRTRLVATADGPVQIVNPVRDEPLPMADLSALPLSARAAAIARLADDEARRPFDLAAGIVWRAMVLRAQRDEHTLLVTLHHVVSDGWSIGLLIREVSAAYEAYARDQEPALAPLPLQYADYALWQRRPEMEAARDEQLAYWRRQLANLPALELPTDSPRAALDTRALALGAVARFALPDDVAGELRALGRREGVTLFMTLLAAFQALLARYSGQSDIVIGTDIANRTQAETDALIGFFVNQLVLRTDVSGDPTFLELLQRVRAMTLDAYAHQDAPFEMLVAQLGATRDPRETPLFRVKFLLEHARRETLALGDLGLDDRAAGPLPAQFDLVLTCAERDGGLRGAVEYRTALFSQAWIETLIAAWQAWLTQLVAHPGHRLSELSLVPASETMALLARGIAADDPEPAPDIVFAIAQAAAARPDAVALVSSDRGAAIGERDAACSVVTYDALRARAARLARALLAATGRRTRLEADAVVAVCVSTRMDNAVALLAVLTAGGVFLPLESSHPAERRRAMTMDARAVAVVVDDGTRDALALAMDDVTLVDMKAEAPASATDDAPHRESPAMTSAGERERLAYVMFTSGSTGRPKGVGISRASLAWYARAFAQGLSIDERVRFLHLAPVGFDVALEEMLPAWSRGGVVVVDEETPSARAIADLERRIVRDQVTYVELTTLLWQAWTVELHESGRRPPACLRTVLVGGERAPATPRHVWRGVELVHVYGLTETSITSTIAAVPAHTADMPIGRPLPGVRVLVLDDRGRPVPAGVAGELCLGGVGVGRGYLGLPSLTASRFVPDPWAERPGARLYRTGDLARWRADHELVFVGRADTQAKVRGHRIEPGEIEAALSRHATVRHCAVMIRPGPSGDAQIVAYVVPTASLAAGSAMDDWRTFLRASVPDYMMPAAWVTMDALPLTGHGKVDRRRLPEPVWQAASAVSRPPRTALQELIAGIWAELLRLPEVGASDSFFELGGHSLLATQVIARVRRACCVDVPLRVLFDTPTVEALAAAVEAARREGVDTPPPLVAEEPRPATAPLSFAQQRMWFLSQLEPDSAAYHIPVAVTLDGPLDVWALRRGVETIEARHELLRTRLVVRDGLPEQEVCAAGLVRMPAIDLSGRHDAEDWLRTYAAAQAARRFDLGAGEVWRIQLVRLSATRHVLLVTLHHIVSDGWSIGVLIREIGETYTAYRAGVTPALPALPVQYADVARWQRRWLTGERLDAQLRYWRTQLADLPTLDLPTDRPRPAVIEGTGATLPVTLEPEVTHALRALSRREGVTMFMVVLAAWQSVLGRHAGQTDVAVGTDVANRTQAETEGLIGFFVNQLVLRADLSGAPTFRDLLHRVRTMALDAYAHQDVPFERLVEALAPVRDASRAPLFQVKLVMEQAEGAGLTLPGLAVDGAGIALATARYDLLLTLRESRDQLSGHLVYASGLFSEATAQRLVDHVLCLLRAVAADASVQPARLDLRAPGEAARLAAWNGAAAAPIVAAPDVLTQFAASVHEQPDAIAVEDGRGVQLTSGALWRRAGAIAAYLRGQGVGPEVRVGVCLPRSSALIEATLGVLRAGGAYVPLDREWPLDRLADVVDAAQAAIVIAERDDASRLPGGWRMLWLDGDEDEIDAAAREAADDAGVAPVMTPDALAYVLFTSGSTGVPKGVAIAHGGLGNLAREQAAAFGIRRGSVVWQFAAWTFDASVSEWATTLAVGGRLVVSGEDERMSPMHLVEALARGGVEVVTLPPSVLAQMPVHPLPALRTLVVAGEASGPELIDRWRADARGVIDAYGPTETTVCATLSECVEPRGLPAIGRPLAGLHVQVLDEVGEPVAIGVPGDLHVGGVGVARGYVGQPRETAARFLPDPESPRPGARRYRTGDRVRWRGDRQLAFLGRLDDQVKIRGHRIEPMEIAARVAAHPDVAQCVVLARARAAGEPRLVAYVVPAPGRSPEPAILRAHVLAALPGYMAPAAWVLLEKMPVTPHGKIDRRALPEPRWSDVSTSEEEAESTPLTPLEEIIAGIWCDLLGLPRVARGQSFFELGGHSLLATQVIARLRQICGVETPLRALFDAPTIEGLAAVVSRAQRGESGPPPMTPVAPRPPVLPLSFAQQRLWVLGEMDPESAAYHVPSAVRLRGPVDTWALSHSLTALETRHEVLRSRLVIRDGAPAQEVLEPRARPLTVVDLTGVRESEESGDAVAGGARDAMAARLSTMAARRRFDLAAGESWRAHLFRLAPDDHILLLTFHHIVSDGWSIGIVIRELSAFYAAAREGRDAALAPLPLQYADVAVWQRQFLAGPVLEAQREYWARQLAALPTLDLPTDYARPAIASQVGASLSFELSSSIGTPLRALGQAEGATLFMVLLAALQALLARYTGDTDIAVGADVANRTHAETESVIGFFVNQLVLRGDLRGEPTFRDLLRRVRGVALDAYAHQDMPFDRLVDELPVRDPSRPPLFAVKLVVQNVPESTFALAGAEADGVRVPWQVSQYDLLLLVRETAGHLQGTLTYATALFAPETAQRFAAHFCQLLTIAASDPDCRPSQVDLRDAAEREQLDRWSHRAPRVDDEAGVGAGAARPATLVSRLRARMQASPDAVAIEHTGGEQVTYAALDRHVTQLAQHLATLGVGPEVRVGICLPRSPRLLEAALAVLWTGGAYVPFDPEWPLDRLAQVSEGAGVALVIAERAAASHLPSEWGMVWLEDWLSSSSTDARGANDEAGVSLPAHLHPDTLAYVIHTSGSTGRPKGVGVTHAGLAAILPSIVRALDIAPGRIVWQFAAWTFDVSVWEWAPTLIGGGRLVFGEESERLPGPAMVEALARMQVELLSLLPTALAVLPPAALPAMRTVATGGEPCPPVLLERWLGTGRRMVDAYGPTETTISATIAERLRRGESPPIGEPLDGVRLHVLDRRGAPTPAGVPGELLIGGVGVARGYVGQPAETARHFVPDPFAETPGARLYRSGDRVRWRPDGQLAFLGRLDAQVKVRGHRIDPAEIEAALLAHGDVRECIVISRARDAGDLHLVAYIVPTAGDSLDAAALRAFAALRLPDYMVPAIFVSTPALPRTSSGKVDRRALPAPGLGAARETVRPRTPVEAHLCEVWAQVLGLPAVGVHDNFFDLGGDSILVIQVVARMQPRGIRLRPVQLFQHQTIAELAPMAAVAAEHVPDQEGVSGDLPLTPVQHWFFEAGRARPQHYNQAFTFALSRPVPSRAIERAVTRVLEHHDALRLRFTRVDDEWRQTNAEQETSRAFGLIDLGGVPAEAREAVHARAVELLQRGFDLAHGPLLRVVRFTQGTDDARRDRLLVTAHHLVVDTVSWRILLEDLQTACLALHIGDALDLPPKTTSYQGWARALAARAATSEVLDEWAYWESLLAGAREPLPIDHPEAPNTIASRTAIIVTLSAADTETLLRDLSAVFGASMPHALLAALAETLGAFGLRSALVDIEGHGREEFEPGLDLSRSVGWFTAAHPVQIECDAGRLMEERVASARRALESAPGGGLGYGLLRYLSARRAEARAAWAHAVIALNYFGQLDRSLEQGSLLVPASDPKGTLEARDGPRSHELELAAEVSGGQLRVIWIYGRHRHDAATIQRWADRYVRALERLARACRRDRAAARGSAAFPEAGLSRKELDRLLARAQRHPAETGH